MIDVRGGDVLPSISYKTYMNKNFSRKRKEILYETHSRHLILCKGSNFDVSMSRHKYLKN